VSQLTFFGHTHVQGGFRIKRGSVVLELDPRHKLHLTRHQSYLVNPGSVGQPRDGDPRAAYALYDPGAHTIQFHRVAYDIEAAARKILGAGLPETLAARLFQGC
jgi:diadenosine tetraphosphatase ApaH/serine/threonine PP2A family protein phosphatase